MKKFFIATCLMVVLAAQSAFASDPTYVSRPVRQSFEKEFAGAQSVNWEFLSSKSIYHATFTVNSEKMHAYFDSEGELLVTGREVKAENLPLLVTKTLQQQYGVFSVSEVVELNDGSQTSYVVKVNKADQQHFVQAYTDGSLNRLKKSRKF